MQLNIKIASIIFFIAMIVLIITTVKNLIDVLINSFNNTTTKIKLRQFNTGVKKDKANTVEQIDSATKFIQVKLFPHLQSFLPSLQLENREKLEKNLKFAGWDDTFTVDSYIATTIGLKIIGVIVFIVFSLMNMIWAGLIICLFCFFLLDKMFKDEIKNKNENLFNSFPELVRIVSGYLMADMDLVRAMKESMKFVSDDWKVILNQFIFDCENKNIDVALDGLKNSVDMFEVKEFVALIKLSLEQGNEVKKSFIEQADKVTELQKNRFLVIIGKRRTYATLLQGPILLCNMIVVGLPTLVTAMGYLSS